MYQKHGTYSYKKCKTQEQNLHSTISLRPSSSKLLRTPRVHDYWLETQKQNIVCFDTFRYLWYIFAFIHASKLNSYYYKFLLSFQSWSLVVSSAHSNSGRTIFLGERRVNWDDTGKNREWNSIFFMVFIYF